MIAPVLAIAPGGKSVGICLTLGTAVVEACTATANAKGASLEDVPALVALGHRVLAVADALLTDHRAAGAVWVLVTPSAPSREGNRRYTAGATHRTQAAVATGVVTGVVLGALAGRGVAPVLVSAPDLTGDEAGTPDLLCGKIPTAWITAHPDRHVRGADRLPQRLAYLAGQTLPAVAPSAVAAFPMIRPNLPTVPPATGARAYIASLVEQIRTAAPATDEELLAAARLALASRPVPDDARTFTAVELAVHAVLKRGIAPRLWALQPDLRARLSAITPTPQRSTR